MTATYVNNAASDAVSNATIDVFETVVSMKVYVRIRLPEDKNDKTFKKELLKTSIDVGKILSGHVGQPPKVFRF